MDTSIETLRDTFKIGFEAFEESRREAQEVIDLLHNRHYTQSQLAVLSNRGQPAETYNVIKRYQRMFLGYFSSIVNTVKLNPRTHDSIAVSAVANDMAQYILEQNDWEYIKDSIESDLISIGLASYYIYNEPTDVKDKYGRTINETKIEYVNPQELVLDPLYTKPDYSDARFIHRFKWLSEEEVIKLYGKSKMDKLTEYYNFTPSEDADFTYKYDTQFTGEFKIFNNYLIIHTVIRDDKGKYWNVHWSNFTELYREEVKNEYIKFPYRIFKVIQSDKSEYYGLFREVIESQKAINQAIIQIQLMVNTNRVFVEGDAAGTDLKKFESLISKINSIIPVMNLDGIRIDNMSSDVVKQYQIIDANINRIQDLLSINDSFLGQAAASDSGRKVKLQQNASVVALRYITNKVEFMYLTLGRDIMHMMKQYYTANQMVSVTDASGELKQKWVEINKPFEMPTGNINEDGSIETYHVYEEHNGEIRMVNEKDTDLAISDLNVKVTTSSYNDTDDIERVFMDSMLQGPVGAAVMNANPQSFFKLVSVYLEGTKTRNSLKIAEIIRELSGEMNEAPTLDPRGQGQGQGQGNAGAMMSAAGLNNFANPSQGASAGSGPIPKGGR